MPRVHHHVCLDANGVCSVFCGYVCDTHASPPLFARSALAVVSSSDAPTAAKAAIGAPSKTPETTVTPCVDLGAEQARMVGVPVLSPGRGKYSLAVHATHLVLTREGKAQGRIIVAREDVLCVVTGLRNDKKRCGYSLLRMRRGVELEVGKAKANALLLSDKEGDEGSAGRFLIANGVPQREAVGGAAVPALLKVTDGALFTLPDALLFTEKLLLLDARDVARIEFGRADRREFDMIVAQMHAGSEGDAREVVHEFKIDSEYLGRVQAWGQAIMQRKAKHDAAAGGGHASGDAKAVVVDDADESDEEESDESDEEDEDFDPELYRQQVQVLERLAREKGASLGPQPRQGAPDVVNLDSDDEFGVAPAAGSMGGAGNPVMLDESGESEGEGNAYADSSDDDYDEVEWVDEDGIKAEDVQRLVKRARRG